MIQISQNLRTGRLSLDEVPAPGLQPGWVLVQSAYSLISAGTERAKLETGRRSLVGKAVARPDQVRQVLQSARALGFRSAYQKVKTRLDARSPLGYSASGLVLAVGSGVEEFRPGDRLACAGASAAHAELIAVPRSLCVPVPEAVPLDAAAFTTLGAIALQGIRQADVRLGEIVGVLGLGLVGQLTLQLLKAAGCRVVGFDPDTARCERALRVGADAAVSNEPELRASLDALSFGQGADAVIIAASTRSSRPVELAGELCRDKGRVVVVGAVGLALPRLPYYDKELSFCLSRSYGPGRYDPNYEEKGLDYPYGYVRWTERRNMEAFLALAASGKLDLASLITHRFNLSQVEDAYALIGGQSTQPYLGVLFEYQPVQREDSLRIEVTGARRPATGQISLGLIGAGNFAQSMLLPHLTGHPALVLLGVAALSPLKSRDAAGRYGFAYAASSAEQILSDPQVQAVIIATRHDSHASLAIQALSAGKAIHLEKPLALTKYELDRMIDAYQQSTIKNHKSSFLMLGFNRRFAPMILAAKDFFAGRREPLMMCCRINAGFVPRSHWTQDSQQGGRILGEVCHFIDLLQFLAGAPPRRVYACALPDIGKYRQDNVAVNLSFQDGSIGTILYLANGDRSLPKERLEISGEGRTAVLDDYRSLVLVAGGRRTVSRRGARDKGHRGEMWAWVEAVRSGTSEPVPFSDSVLAAQATFAVLESLSTGQPVELKPCSIPHLLIQKKSGY